jgi:hypothetical protein
VKLQFKFNYVLGGGLLEAFFYLGESQKISGLKQDEGYIVFYYFDNFLCHFLVFTYYGFGELRDHNLTMRCDTKEKQEEIGHETLL